MRLKVRNVFERQQDADFYNPIDLNHIFTVDDILDNWIREGEEPILDGQRTDWIEGGLQQAAVAAAAEPEGIDQDMDDSYHEMHTFFLNPGPDVGGSADHRSDDEQVPYPSVQPQPTAS